MSTTDTLTAGAELKLALAQWMAEKMEGGATLAQAGEQLRHHLAAMVASRAALTDLLAGWTADED